MGRVMTNTIFFQEIEKLFLIASFRVMCRLARDVPNDIFRLRSAHAEGTVSSCHAKSLPAAFVSLIHFEEHDFKT